jgi:SnoaL-like domain
MDALDRVLIVDACERLSLDYARWIDLGQASRASGLFTEDAELTLSAGPLSGRPEIRAFFEKREGADVVSRHVITNITVDVQSPTRATGTAYLTFYRQPGNGDDPAPLDRPLFVGHYEDEYHLTDDGWRFKKRKSVVAFQS